MSKKRRQRATPKKAPRRPTNNSQPHRDKAPPNTESEAFYANLTGPLLYEWKLWLSKNKVTANYQLVYLVKKFINEERKKQSIKAEEVNEYFDNR